MPASEIDAKQAHALIAAGAALLIDVRESGEFAAGHIAQALSIPLADLPRALPELAGAGADADKRTIIFQCARGMRGQQACAAAAGHGIDPSRTRNLAGGIDAWRAAGLPVTGTGGGVSIFRQVQIIIGTLVLIATLAGLAGWHAGFYIAALFGGALAIAGISGWCGLALLLQRMPWNRA